jgi:hypothetical protein
MRRPPEKPRSRRKPGRLTSVADAGSSTAAARRAERGEFAPEMPAGKAPQRQPKPPSASVAPEVGRTKIAKRSRSDDPAPERRRRIPGRRVNPGTRRAARRAAGTRRPSSSA